MTLAKSQFFFLRNKAILSVATSCGSKLKVTSYPSTLAGFNSIKSPTVLQRMTGLAQRANVYSYVKPQSLTTGPAATRKFSTFRILSNKVMEREPADVSKAAQAFNKSNLKGRPINSARSVGYWLLGLSGMVAGIVVLGGLTRLTESGLSITEWKPVTGALPPMNQADWQREFDLYRDSPEFKILNSNMTLEEYKFIYYMEWSHRLVGRTIGLVLLIPAVYFVATNKTSKPNTRHLIGITALLGLQGFIGWWMVKSGLDDKFLDDKSSHPRVSQYRLATHLGAAFLLYIALVNTGLGILKEARWLSAPVQAMKEIAQLKSPIAVRFRRINLGLTVITFVTAMAGAFVAGLDAGMIYNTFPKMGNSLTPSKDELFDGLYASNPESKWNLFWKNMLENPATVQLNHRILAVTTFVLFGAAHFYSLKYRHVLPRSAIKMYGACFGLVTLQAGLGIATLCYVVPTPLAASHQAGAVLLLTGALVLARTLKLPRAQIETLLSILYKRAQKSAQTSAKAAKIVTPPLKK